MLLQQRSMTAAKLNRITVSPSVSYQEEFDSELFAAEEESHYRQILGRLVGLAVRTSPDSRAAARILVSNEAELKQNHLLSENQVLPYMCGTILQESLIQPAEVDQLRALVDTSKGSATEQPQKSRTGFLITYEKNCI